MYWQYWKRGWWVLLLHLSVNLISVAFFVPMVFIFGENKIGYYTGCGIMALIAILPIAGWLFELVAKKAKRIGEVKGP